MAQGSACLAQATNMLEPHGLRIPESLSCSPSVWDSAEVSGLFLENPTDSQVFLRMTSLIPHVWYKYEAWASPKSSFTLHPNHSQAEASYRLRTSRTLKVLLLTWMCSPLLERNLPCWGKRLETIWWNKEWQSLDCLVRERTTIQNNGGILTTSKSFALPTGMR